ncbi:phospholipase D-like domain-containing protein [Thiovibrio sp. JS02]
MAKLILPASAQQRKAAILAVFLCLLLIPPRLAGAAGGRNTPLPAPPPGGITILADKDYFAAVESLLNNARERIDLAMFLFKKSDAKDNRPGRLVDALIAAANRGVQVRVILEYSGHEESINKANQQVAEALKRGKVTVLFDSARRTSHAKLIVVDNRYCIVGSHNLSQSALKYNHELSLLIDSRELAAKILAYMETLSR